MRGSFKMAPHEWATLRALLDEALTLPASEREAWVDRLEEARHAALKPRLKRLLAHASDATEPAIGVARLLDTLPKVETGQFALPPDAAATPPDRVGPYRLIRELGSGGMASVWLAERTDMLQGRQVALKLPHGAWKRAGLAERLSREREILATLEHPHIARLYDAAVADDGQPFLALEYVQGEAIDAYAQRKALDVPARLRLFLQAVRAVAHAHAQLVVHRDLKPGNILVSEAGDVKLLDFGIAKLLDHGVAAETELTREAGRALTPEYAAPEQILGKPIGTAADVYALGVVLYELLTGRRPYQLKRDSRAALEEAILHAEVARPSSVAPPARRKALQGDLDTIVLKALKKTPEERYRTADALAEDIERHLAREPVLARADSRWYRVRKFVSRHRLSVATSAAVAVAVMAGTGLALWQAQRALEEQRRAQEVKDFIVSIFEGADIYRGAGAKLSAVDLLNQARSRVDRHLAGRPELRLELLTLIGYSLNNLHEVKAAEALLRAAVNEGRTALGAEHRLVLRAREAHALTLRYVGSATQQRETLEALIPALRAHSSTLAPELVRALESRVVLAWAEGRHAQAEADAREMLAMAKTRLGEDHAMATDAMWALATSLQHQDRFGEALDVARQAWPRTLALNDGNTRAPAVIEAGAAYGRLLARAGDLEAGLRLQAQAVADAGQVFGPRSVAVGFMAANLARAQLDAGQLHAALANIDLALQALHEAPGRDSPAYATALERRAQILMAARRPQEAAAVFGDVVAAFERLRGPTGAGVHAAALDRAHALALTGDVVSAQQAFDALAERFPGAPGGAANEILRVRGVLLRLAGDARAALLSHEQALAELARDTKTDARRAALLTEIGLDLLQLREPERADAALQEALALSIRVQPAATPARADIWLALGRAQLARGDAAAATRWLQQADAFWREFDPANREAADAARWLARAEGNPRR